MLLVRWYAGVSRALSARAQPAACPVSRRLTVPRASAALSLSARGRSGAAECIADSGGAITVADCLRDCAQHSTQALLQGAAAAPTSTTNVLSSLFRLAGSLQQLAKYSQD